MDHKPSINPSRLILACCLQPPSIPKSTLFVLRAGVGVGTQAPPCPWPETGLALPPFDHLSPLAQLGLQHQTQPEALNHLSPRWRQRSVCCPLPLSGLPLPFNRAELLECRAEHTCHDGSKLASTATAKSPCRSSPARSKNIIRCSAAALWHPWRQLPK